jgi:hypothetical protein
LRRPLTGDTITRSLLRNLQVMALLGKAPRRPDCRPAPLDQGARRAPRSVLGLLAGVVLLAAGCAGAAPGPSDPAAFDEEGDVPMAGNARAANRATAAPAPAAEPDTEAARPVVEIPTEAAGTIPRTDLIEVLDRGPGHFLAGIEIEATFEGKRFAGWEIVSFTPADERLTAAPLAPGDVVTAVNTRPISRPRQLQAVWDELRAANSLVIEGRRSGRPFALRYDIAP